VDHFRERRLHVGLEEAAELRTDTTPEDEAQRRSDFEHLARLLARLDERERELLSLKYGAGLTNRAIAKLMRMSESNVGTILHRTIAALRADWDQGA
jgi:RNA polymerase sigma-70 factor (ECF subfamily)